MTGNRFRNTYRQLTDGEKADMDQIKNLAQALSDKLEIVVKNPRHQAIALTNLEQSIMWAIKGITE